MDLTAILQSVLSLDGLVGHASYVLLIVSMLMTRMSLLRLLAIASGVLSIVYSAMIGDFVSLFWDVLFVGVNLAQLALIAHRNRSSRFTAEERLFRESFVPLLEPALARRLIDAGQWRQAEAGEVLICQGEMVSHMIFIAAGEVAISVNGAQVGRCGPASVVGEIGVLTDMPATATVTVVRPLRYLAIERHALQGLMARELAIEHAIDESFRKSMRQKLAAANAALADAEMPQAASIPSV